MSQEDYSYASQAMQMYGGSFVKCIGEAWAHADQTNRIRVQNAFEAEFERYAAFFTLKVPA